MKKIFILSLLVTLVFIGTLYTTIKTINAQYEGTTAWDVRSDKMAILLPDTWVKDPTSNVFHPPENSNVFVSIISYNPTPNTVFPSIYSPIKEVAEGMIRINMPSTPNFKLDQVVQQNINQYGFWYLYDKDGVETFEYRNFGIDNYRLYEVKASVPLSLVEQYTKGLSNAGTFIFGSEWDEYIGPFFTKFEGDFIKIDICTKRSIIDNIRSGPATERYYDSYCDIWRYR
jgi:hypothetical protein